MELPAQVTGEVELLDTTGYLLHNATLQSPEDIAALDRNKHREAAKIRKQRNMSQMKEQNKIPEKELNKMETSNLLDM